MFRIASLLAVAALVVGCAAQPEVKAPSAVDPANPQAPVAPVGSLASPLTLEAPPATGSGASSHGQDMPGMDMKGMDMSRMSNMQHGSAPAESGPATRPATRPTFYTCKMHPQVISDHPGNCPICGMKLIPKAGAK